MQPWMAFIAEKDRLAYEAAGYGRAMGLGRRAALMVVDVTYAFTGDRPAPILESIARWPNSCGEVAWQAIPRIAFLLGAARASGSPVIYTRGQFRPDGANAGNWAAKFSRMLEAPADAVVDGDAVVAELAPAPGDIVLIKDKPSAFFGTPLVSHLVERGVDTLIWTGCTTSGCVRASVVDGFSYNYKQAVVSDCVFDRSETSHAVGLFDMGGKYADLLGHEEAAAHLTRRANAEPGRAA